jgi:hypothetical protein
MRDPSFTGRLLPESLGVTFPCDEAFTFHIDGQRDNCAFDMSLVTSRFNGPGGQDALQTIWRVYACAKFFRRQYLL